MKFLTRIAFALFAAITVLSTICASAVLSDDTPSVRPVVLVDHMDSRSINASSHFIIDSTNSRSVAQISTLDSYAWQSHPTLPFNGGYLDHPVWIYLTVVDSSASAHSSVLTFNHPLLDSIHIFIRDSAHGEFRIYATGGLKTAKKYPACIDPEPSFALPRNSGRSYELLIRVKTSDVYALSLSVMNEEHYARDRNISRLLEGGYFGAVLILALVNILLFVFVRLSSCKWYTLYILSFGFFQAAAGGLLEFLGIFPLGACTGITPILANITLITGLVFVGNFLTVQKPDKRDRIINALLKLCAVSAGVLIIAAIVLGNRVSSIGISVLAPCFILICGAASWTRIGRLGRPAQFMLGAIAIMALGIIVNTLRNFGICPQNVVTSYSNLWGSVIEFIILTVALAYRIAEIEKDKQGAILKSETVLRHAAEDQLHMLKTYREQKLQHAVAVNRLDTVEKENVNARVNLEIAQRLAAEDRLRALQAQINPHFLFNTLNTLAEQIVVAPTTAEELVIALSRYFRYTLTTSACGTVLLSAELESIETYLGIEKMCLGSRLDYSIVVSGDPAQCTVTGLLIQPIVENSIKYAIAPSLTGGKIEIVCTILDNTVSICVKDNGPGFGKSMQKSGAGHGLNNVRERLSLTYGDAAQLNYFDINGAVVEIVFPRKIS